MWCTDAPLEWRIAMQRLGSFLALASGLALAATALAADGDLRKAPPGGGYKKVSELVKLPDFLPGMGTLYVKPETLPAGPFLAYDRNGKLVSTTYMIPMKDLEAKKKFDDLAVAKEKVDHVDLYFNAGHPGVEEPHYHVVLWYIPEGQEKTLAGK
jgi:hypothetical protein